MPPRLALSVLPSLHPTYQPLAPFLYPSLIQQSRAASILSSLSDTKGSYNKRIRVGRGPSSGYGKTSGRGHKGQNQHGKVPVGFNGGQTPDWVVSGTRGDGPNMFAPDLSKINLNKIQAWINLKRLDPAAPITLRELADSRCIHGVRPDGVKLLARGKEELTSPINIIVSRASAEAIKAVEAAGGTVTTRYYTKFAVNKIRKGEMDPVHSLQSQINGVSTDEQGRRLGMKTAQYKYRLPDPASRKDLEYYRDEGKRGYLSHTVAEGHGPSLFFRTPEQERLLSKKRASGSAKKTSAGGSESRLW